MAYKGLCMLLEMLREQHHLWFRELKNSLLSVHEKGSTRKVADKEEENVDEAVYGGGEAPKKSEDKNHMVVTKLTKKAWTSSCISENDGR